MKAGWKFLLLMFSVIALSGYCLAAGPEQGTVEGQAAPAPSVQLSETSYNFGELIETKEYLHDFKVKNVGTAPLEIKKVLPS
jgi:hypothetical protein